MTPRLYRLADTPSLSPPPDSSVRADARSVSRDPHRAGNGGSNSSSGSFVDEEPLDKVVESMMTARKVLVPASAQASEKQAFPRRRRKRRLLAGVDADREHSASSESSASSSSSGIPTPDVAADADPEDYHARRRTLTMMPHPVLHRYPDDNESDRYVDPENPSPLSPTPVVNLAESPPVRVDDPSAVVDLLDSPQAQSSSVQPRMSANDLDDLFGDEDPSSPPPQVVTRENEVQSPPLSPVLDVMQNPSEEAMMEADAWRPAVLGEAKMAYDHFAKHVGVEADYACAVMPVEALLRVMECVGTLLGAQYSTETGPTGSHVDLRRSADAVELPDLESFEDYVSKTLDAIIVQDVIERDKAKRQKEEEANRVAEEQEREAARKRPRGPSERGDDGGASPVVSQGAIDRATGTPGIVGPSVRYRSISVPRSTRSRTPVISFHDYSPPESPPPPRLAASQARRQAARALSPEYSSSSSDEPPPRPYTRAFALKQKRIYAKEKARMLGRNANIDDLRRHSYKMQIRLANRKKKRHAKRRLKRVVLSPDTSAADLAEKVSVLPLPHQLEDDEVEERPATRAARTRLPHTIDISDDEVEVQPVVQVKARHKREKEVPQVPRRRPAPLAFQPKVSTPSSYMAIMTGALEDLEWGEMGDNFTVLGRRPRSERRYSPVERPQKTPFSFQDYWQTQMQQASAQRVSAIPGRPRLRSEFKASADVSPISGRPRLRSELKASKDTSSAKAEPQTVTYVDDERLELVEQRIEEKQRELERLAREKVRLADTLRANKASTGPRINRVVSGGRISKKNGKTKKNSGSIGGLSRKQLRQLRVQEEDYREKEDPRHPEYVPRAQQLEQQLALQREGQKRMGARWAGETKRQKTEADETESDHRAKWEAHQERLRQQRQTRVEMHEREERQPSWTGKSGGVDGSSRTRERRRRRGAQGGEGRREERERRHRRDAQREELGGRRRRDPERASQGQERRRASSGFGGNGDRDPLRAARIGSSNRGFAMMEKMGWREGEGLGTSNHGRTSPIAPARTGGRSGLGGYGR